jgi:sarcosine oxidase gamma subunit
MLVWGPAATIGVPSVLAGDIGSGVDNGSGVSAPEHKGQGGFAPDSLLISLGGGWEAMRSRFRTVRLSTASSVNVSGGQAIISINGRVCRVDAKDAVSIRVVSDGSNTYVEIMDKHGRTRRVDCEG